MIVGDHEADIKAGRIAISAPLARAMIGRERGDTVTLETGKGMREYEIADVHFEARTSALVDVSADSAQCWAASGHVRAAAGPRARGRGEAPTSRRNVGAPPARPGRPDRRRRRRCLRCRPAPPAPASPGRGVVGRRPPPVVRRRRRRTAGRRSRRRPRPWSGAARLVPAPPRTSRRRAAVVASPSALHAVAARAVAVQLAALPDALFAGGRRKQRPEQTATI